MKKLILIGALFFSGIAGAQYSVVSEASSVLGPVITGKLLNDSETRYIPFSPYTSGNPVIATEAFAMPRAGATITEPFNLNGVSEGKKLWLSKYTSGTGHKDAPTTLGAESQYMLVGGREYGAGTFRGIGFGYVGSITDIAPVFVGVQEVGTDRSTTGNLVFATRSELTNTPPVVRMTITPEGTIKANALYTPATPEDLITKQYFDKVIGPALERLDALDRAPK